MITKTGHPPWTPQSFLANLCSWFEHQSPKTETRMIAATCLLFSAVSLLAILFSGKTFTYHYVHDLTTFFEGAHRLLIGQQPNVEFHSPLGPAAYFLLASGVKISGSFGGMMPVATMLFTLLYVPMLIYICASRLPLGHALLFAIFGIALVVTPNNIGELLPSFAMFYNRWGYALISLLFMIYLAPIRPIHRPWADAIIVAAILLLTFYLKVSYFGFALLFVLGLAIFTERRVSALLALALSLGGFLVMHLAWDGTSTYLSDLARTAGMVGVLRGSLLPLFGLVAHNPTMVVPFAILALLAISRGIGMVSLLFCMFMAAAGFALANQNAQGVDIVTLVPSGIALSVVSGGFRTGTAGSWRMDLPIVAILCLPYAVGAMEGVGRQAWNGIKDPRGEGVAELGGVVAIEHVRPSLEYPGLEDLRLAYGREDADIELLTVARTLMVKQQLAQPEYLWTLKDAIRLLRNNRRLEGKVFILDHSSSLNAFLGRPSPRGIDSWMDGRTFSKEVHRPPEEFFADIDIVMIPKAPANPFVLWQLRQIYGPYIQRNYKFAARSDYWHAYLRNPLKVGQTTPSLDTEILRPGTDDLKTKR